jgi:hypothetical protein
MVSETEQNPVVVANAPLTPDVPSATAEPAVDQPSDRLAQVRTKAAEAGSSVRQIVEQHPLAALAGGIALGLVVGKLASGRRKPVPRNAFADLAAPIEQAAAGLGKKTSALASLAADVALAYAAKAADAGREGVHKLEDIGSDAGGKLAGGAHEARKKAGDIAEAAAGVAREAADLAIAKVNELASRLKR